MFGIGGFELFIILLFGFLIFGPDKLPEIAKTVGAAIAKFKKAQEEMSAVLKSEVLEASEQADKKSSSVKNNNAKEEASEPETFAERKARYDKERAERRQRETIERNRSAMKKESADHAHELEKTETTQEQADAKAAGADADAKESVVKENTEKKEQALTADQLYGNVPIKPSAKKEE